MPVKKIRLFPLFVAASTVAVMSACESSTDVPLLNDATITADVAASAGDAIALSVTNMVTNETAATLSNIEALPTSNVVDNTLTYSRTRTCLDVNGAVVVACTPLTSVRKIATRVTMDGTRSGSSPDATKSWTGAVHRVSNDTVTRVFTGSTETSRIHADVATGNDTTTFTEGTFSRKVIEAGLDSVKQVTWNVPRSTNPWPISGSIKRVATVKVTVTKGDRTETRDVVRTITVTFPPDAQGNVVMTINGKTCNLNLVTHAVTACT
jgi:hypothetical protein